MKLVQIWQMNSSSDGKQPHGNRTLITVAIVFVCYMNLAEIIEVSCLQLSLPRPYPLAQLFHMFSLWSDYTEWNSGYEAEGLAINRHKAQSDSPWIPIHVHEFFPSIHGDANRMLSIHDDLGVSSEQGFENEQNSDFRIPREQDSSRLLEALIRCHNRAHPDMPIDRMRLYLVCWPSSPRGYFHQYDQRWRRLLYVK